MRILTTGAAGFVGSHLCERLVADGHEVVGLDGLIPDSYPAVYKTSNLAGLRGSDRFTFHRLDLRCDPLDEVVEGIDAVIHLAAMPGLPISWERLDLYTECNLLATGRLIEAVSRTDLTRFLQVSTSSVYGRFAVGDELQPLRPSSPYGLTKLAAENLVMAHHENFGLPAVILRYFSIYGPRQRPDMAYHIFFESLLEDRPITVFGDGGQSRSNTYVSDCVDATVRALHSAPAGEIYNIGGGEVVTLNAAIATISELTGREPTIIRKPARPGDQRSTEADTTKARTELGYVPSVGVSAGLSAQFAWHTSRRERALT
jgi:UDP-glucuronate 4-epimerase